MSNIREGKSEEKAKTKAGKTAKKTQTVKGIKIRKLNAVLSVIMSIMCILCLCFLCLERFSLRHHFFLVQITFISIILVLIILVLVLLDKLVFSPLEKSVKSINDGVKMKVKGSYEVNFIEKAYNELCEKNVVTAQILKHKAEHDPLTGLINREAFDHIKEALVDNSGQIAYLIIDIDLFKRINDEYGHSIGDDILRKISSLLMEQFRSTDYVARIGGDEFAIIMTKFGSSPTEIIQKKIEGLNSMLQNVDDGLPGVSLSVGVAFSEHGYKDELVDQADKALYRVKNGGRCNCSFFGA